MVPIYNIYIYTLVNTCLYLDMDMIYGSVFVFEIFVLCIVYYLYIIHAGCRLCCDKWGD